MQEAFGADRLRPSVPLAPLTTFRVGGAAEWLIETRSSDELVAALTFAHAAGVPVTMLGGGSNVLVADRGVRGLVIRPRGGDVVLAGDDGVRADAACHDQRTGAAGPSITVVRDWKRGPGRLARSAGRYSATPTSVVVSSASS
jgi:hypothetical protein